MKTFNHISRLGMVCAAIIISLSLSCKKDRNNNNNNNNQDTDISGPDLTFFALTTDSRLLTLNAKNASSIVATANITGLQTGETLLGIDFRPATGQLYGIGNTSRIYIIDTKTGAARMVGSAPFTPALTTPAKTAGFDFNPTVDRIRYVGSDGQNLRFNPETGTVAATDGVINGVTNASVGAVAYTQNRAGASTTVLFDIDITTDKLYKQDPPNDGKLTEVGALTVNAEAASGFDITPDGSLALAALTVAGKTSLYSIDMMSGKASKIKNDLPAGITGLAIPTEPVAFAVSTNNELVIFNPANPSPVIKPITGMAAGESILGIDFRPVNGQLYALGSTSRLYTINASSGVAATVGASSFSTILSGTDFGFDFNPTVDRIRVVSNTGQNLRLNPNDGLIAAVDGALTPGTISISGAAYTNNFAGATTTMLFDIDAQTGRLYSQNPPNNGTLIDVGALGVTADAANGFDIGSTSGIAYALLTVGGVTKVYTINLQTGAATAGATLSASVKGFTVGLGF